MEQMQALKQMIQMNKLAFDNSYNMLMSAYEQNKLMFSTFLNQTTGLPAEAKQAIEGWMRAYKDGCEEFKKMLDTNYRMVEDQLSKVKK